MDVIYKQGLGGKGCDATVVLCKRSLPTQAIL